MPFYLPEPPYKHDQAARVGILLINLGTPDAPTAAAVRPYLKEFLWDRRVVEIPRPLWWLILNGIILNTRPAKSAEKYASIWLAEGSPLKVHTERTAKLLKGLLGERLGQPVLVDYAMRYGRPAVADRIAAMRAQGVERLLVLPLYPQYAASSTGTAFDGVYREMLKIRNTPGLRTIRNFHDHSGYIKALANNINDYWMKNGRPEKLVMSFHGLPQFSLDKGDPYHCECHKTGRLLAQELGLKSGQYFLSFQSRFGKAEWLKPYTTTTLKELGKKKTQRVDVVCPGFVADCLETLEEIAMEGKEDFLQAGGGEYHYIPCLNERSDWMHALTDLVMENLHGWLVEPNASELEQGRLKALEMGAKK